MYAQRVLSGMRPTGNLHLGHYHGVLKNWISLQAEYECLFFVADWHALTTHYDNPSIISDSVWNMVIDWIAAGVDPAQSTLFIQSRDPEHAELHLLLSMCTPLGWLERVPSFKDQQEKIHDKDLSTYGFLGYPLLQAADILIYRADQIPVGDDQVPHVELTREIARRFNFLFGGEADFEKKALEASKKLGGKRSRLILELRQKFQEQGDEISLERAKAILQDSQNLTMDDRERLFGYLEGVRRLILVEPQPLLTLASRFTGLDGQKMSKSYGNTIGMREEPDKVVVKLKKMPTDPARVRRSDPGSPENCPVWSLHKIYSNNDLLSWVKDGCKTASIGCVECKKPLIDSIVSEQKVFRERAKPYEEDIGIVKNIIADGCERARDLAKQTMRDVREAMDIDYT
ncbi:MAG: tryptophan--tRNA ligase [Betaproteobacteria bacterium TMED156]|nr:MAG: tryptophan--tRNA ligase [Betaproteobacteria bacterium TMED156]